MDGSNDARALLLVELAWSSELLKRAPAWGGNWLRRARGGRWISELHSLYRRARWATQPAWMRDNYSSLVIVRVDKMVKEEIGERRRCAILGRRLASFK